MSEDEPDGSYRVSDSGGMVRYEHSTDEEESEEEREARIKAQNFMSACIDCAERN